MFQQWAGAPNQHVEHCSCSPGLCWCSLLSLKLGECLGGCSVSLCGLPVPLAEGALQQREVTGEGETGERAEQTALSPAGRIGG